MSTAYIKNVRRQKINISYLIPPNLSISAMTWPLEEVLCNGRPESPAAGGPSRPVDGWTSPSPALAQPPSQLAPPRCQLAPPTQPYATPSQPVPTSGGTPCTGTGPQSAPSPTTADLVDLQEESTFDLLWVCLGLLWSLARKPEQLCQSYQTVRMQQCVYIGLGSVWLWYHNFWGDSPLPHLTLSHTWPMANQYGDSSISEASWFRFTWFCRMLQLLKKIIISTLLLDGKMQRASWLSQFSSYHFLHFFFFPYNSLASNFAF